MAVNEYEICSTSPQTIQMIRSASSGLLENRVGVATPIFLPLFCLNIQAIMTHLLEIRLIIHHLATLKIYSATPKQFKYTVSWT